MRRLALGIVFFIFGTAHGFVGRLLYDKQTVTAQRAFERGDFQRAQEEYLVLLENTVPGSREYVQTQYNLSCVSLARGEFEAAVAYAQAAIEDEGIPQELKERANCNWGYALFKQKKLSEAFERYEVVLADAPGHEVAQHNAELIKKMLEQQEQQEQEKNDEQKNEQESDENEKSQQQEQSQGDQVGGEEGQKEEGNQDGDQDRDKDQGQAKQDQQLSDRERSNQGLENHEADDKQNEQSEHTGTPEQQKAELSSQDRAESSPAQEQQSNVVGGDAWEQALKDAPELVALLHEQEERDEQTGKDMVKHAINQNMPTDAAQQCW